MFSIQDDLSNNPTSSGHTEGDSSGQQQMAEDGAITAEMQGTVLSIEVSPGDEILPEDVVCVLEAMKIENDVVATIDGTVAEVPVSPDESVDMGDVLVIL